jgi:hypothetical protein
MPNALETRKEQLERNYEKQLKESVNPGQKSDEVYFLLWYNLPDEELIKDSGRAKGRLKDIPYDNLERVLEIHTPPVYLKNQLQRLSETTFFDFGKRFRKPIAEIRYTGLRKPLVKGDCVNCIPKGESRKLARFLETRFFDVIACDYRRNATIILYASSNILSLINLSIDQTEGNIRVLKRDLEEFS